MLCEQNAEFMNVSAFLNFKAIISFPLFLNLQGRFFP